MRALLLSMLLAACGSSAGRSPAPTNAEPAMAGVYGPADLAAHPAPVTTPPAPAARSAPTVPIYDRLRDADGPIPGMPGFAFVRTPSKVYCGGFAVTITRSAQVAAADAPFAELLAIAFPTGLDFAPERRSELEASRQRFDEFVADLSGVARKASAFYSGQLRDHEDAATQLAATARVAQIEDRVASVLARAEISKDLRTADAAVIAAYCEELASHAEPILRTAEDAARTCSGGVAKTGVHGWWDAVCVDRN